MSRVVSIKSWEQASDCLRRKGEAEIVIARIEGRLTEQVNRLKEKAGAECAAYHATVFEIDAALEAWFREHRGTARIVELTFGVLKLRTSRAVKLLRSVDAVIEALGHGFAKYLRKRFEIDRQAMLKGRPSDEAGLRRCGVTFEDRETFLAEPDRQAIARLGKEVA